MSTDFRNGPLSAEKEIIYQIWSAPANVPAEEMTIKLNPACDFNVLAKELINSATLTSSFDPRFADFLSLLIKAEKISWTTFLRSVCQFKDFGKHNCMNGLCLLVEHGIPRLQCHSFGEFRTAMEMCESINETFVWVLVGIQGIVALANREEDIGNAVNRPFAAALRLLRDPFTGNMIKYYKVRKVVNETAEALLLVEHPDIEVLKIMKTYLVRTFDSLFTPKPPFDPKDDSTRYKQTQTSIRTLTSIFSCFRVLCPIDEVAETFQMFAQIKGISFADLVFDMVHAALLIKAEDHDQSNLRPRGGRVSFRWQISVFFYLKLTKIWAALVQRYAHPIGDIVVAIERVLNSLRMTLDMVDVAWKDCSIQSLVLQAVSDEIMEQSEAQRLIEIRLKQMQMNPEVRNFSKIDPTQNQKNDIGMLKFALDTNPSISSTKSSEKLAMMQEVMMRRKSTFDSICAAFCIDGTLTNLSSRLANINLACQSPSSSFQDSVNAFDNSFLLLTRISHHFPTIQLKKIVNGRKITTSCENEGIFFRWAYRYLKRVRKNKEKESVEDQQEQEGEGGKIEVMEQEVGAAQGQVEPTAVKVEARESNDLQTSSSNVPMSAPALTETTNEEVPGSTTNATGETQDPVADNVKQEPADEPSAEPLSGTLNNSKIEDTNPGPSADEAYHEPVQELNTQIIADEMIPELVDEDMDSDFMDLEGNDVLAAEDINRGDERKEAALNPSTEDGGPAVELRRGGIRNEGEDFALREQVSSNAEGNDLNEVKAEIFDKEYERTGRRPTFIHGSSVTIHDDEAETGGLLVKGQEANGATLDEGMIYQNARTGNRYMEIGSRIPEAVEDAEYPPELEVRNVGSRFVGNDSSQMKQGKLNRQGQEASTSGFETNRRFENGAADVQMQFGTAIDNARGPMDTSITAEVGTDSVQGIGQTPNDHLMCSISLANAEEARTRRPSPPHHVDDVEDDDEYVFEKVSREEAKDFLQKLKDNAPFWDETNEKPDFCRLLRTIPVVGDLLLEEFQTKHMDTQVATIKNILTSMKKMCSLFVCLVQYLDCQKDSAARRALGTAIGQASELVLDDFKDETSEALKWSFGSSVLRELIDEMSEKPLPYMDMPVAAMFVARHSCPELEISQIPEGTMLKKGWIFMHRQGWGSPRLLLLLEHYNRAGVPELWTNFFVTSMMKLKCGEVMVKAVDMITAFVMMDEMASLCRMLEYWVQNKYLQSMVGYLMDENAFGDVRFEQPYVFPLVRLLAHVMLVSAWVIDFKKKKMAEEKPKEPPTKRARVNEEDETAQDPPDSPEALLKTLEAALDSAIGTFLRKLEIGILSSEVCVIYHLMRTIAGAPESVPKRLLIERIPPKLIFRLAYLDASSISVEMFDVFCEPGNEKHDVERIRFLCILQRRKTT